MGIEKKKKKEKEQIGLLPSFFFLFIIFWEGTRSCERHVPNVPKPNGYKLYKRLVFEYPRFLSLSHSNFASLSHCTSDHHHHHHHHFLTNSQKRKIVSEKNDFLLSREKKSGCLLPLYTPFPLSILSRNGSCPKDFLEKVIPIIISRIRFSFLTSRSVFLEIQEKGL